MALANPTVRKVRWRLLSATGLLAGWAATVWNDWNAVVRLDSPSLNALCLLVAYCLPWIALTVVLLGLTGWLRITGLSILALPLLFTLLFGPFVLLHLLSVRADGGKDASFELLAAAPVEGGRVAFYRTNCGATCSFGIAVRQERRLLWRVVLVRDLGGFYPAHGARYESLGPTSIRVSVPPYVAIPGYPARSEVYDIRPWLYF